jgi:hypothetical protein
MWLSFLKTRNCIICGSHIYVQHLFIPTYGLFLALYVRPLFGFLNNLWQAKAFPRQIRSQGENTGLEVNKTPARFTPNDPPSKCAGEVAVLFGTHTHITHAIFRVFARPGGTQSTMTLYRVTYMTFEDYRNNKTKNRTSENKSFKFISV